MAEDALSIARSQIGTQLAEMRSGMTRLSPLDFHRRMDSIRRLAADHGMVALEGLARSSAQLALLPGHRVAMQCCLEHAEEAMDGRCQSDCTAILAALALRLH